VGAHLWLVLARSCLQVRLMVAAVQPQLKIVVLQGCSWALQQEV
jgi:hypothetical protein